MPARRKTARQSTSPAWVTSKPMSSTPQPAPHLFRLLGLAVFFLLLTGAKTPALAIGGCCGGGGDYPVADPCSLFHLSAGQAAFGDQSPAAVEALGSPGGSEYYMAFGYGVFVCGTNTYLSNEIVFATTGAAAGNVGLAYNNAANYGTYTAPGYFASVMPKAKLDVSGYNPDNSS